MIDNVYDFTLSQTALKHFEEGCHKKWKGRWIDKTIPFFTNLKMDYGNYFEYLAIGSGATDNVVSDLPRLKNGEKSANQKRIEEQADYFKNEIVNIHSENYLGYGILSTQKIINTDKYYKLRGVVDIESVDSFSGEIVFNDLKLTADVNASNHPKHWGNPLNEIDITQAEFYQFISFLEGKYIPKFSYLVFDYSPKKGRKEILVGSKNDFISIKERISGLYEKLYEYSITNEWIAIPSKWECESCNLECALREFNFIH